MKLPTLIVSWGDSQQIIPQSIGNFDRSVLPAFTAAEIVAGLDTRWRNATFVYLMLNLRNGFVKIGKSKKPKHREKTLQSEEPEIVLLCAYWTDPDMEQELHSYFSDKRVRGEWFHLSPEEIEVARRALRDIACELDERLMPEVLADYGNHWSEQ
jgi:Meiotically up-regulated gene 113